MLISVDEELREICKKIILESKTLSEWSTIESDDYYSTQHYSGGFDAIEAAFCFSYFDELGKEFWFQLSLDEVQAVSDDRLRQINIRYPS